MTTDDQRALRFIADYTRQNGYPPSRREVADELAKSVSSGQAALQRLVEAGLLEVHGHVSRGLRITASGQKALVETM